MRVKSFGYEEFKNVFSSSEFTCKRHYLFIADRYINKYFYNNMQFDAYYYDKTSGLIVLTVSVKTGHKVCNVEVAKIKK